MYDSVASDIPTARRFSQRRAGGLEGKFRPLFSLATFAAIVFLIVGVPVMPAVVLSLCVGCGDVAFLTAGVDHLNLSGRQ